MLTVRAARREDASTILELIRALAEYEKLAHEARATPEQIEAALFGPSPRVFCDLVESDGIVVGFALWFYNFSTFRGKHGIYLEDLFVRPEYRGKGAGKALLACLVRRCVTEDLGRLEWAVLDWNEPSIGFYRSIGARLLDDWTVCRLDGAALSALGGGLSARI